MALQQIIQGGQQPDPRLRSIFTPAGGNDQSLSDILATFKGFGKQGVGRERFLDAAERFKMISAEQRAAAGVVAETPAAEGAAALGERAGTAAGAVRGGGAAAVAAQTGAAATVVSDNPIYRGLYAQMLIRDHGFQIPAARPQVVAEEAVPATAAAAEEIVERAAPLTDAVVDGTPAPAAAGGIAGATDDAAARFAALEQRLVAGFQRIGALPQEQRLPALAKVVDAGAAAGHGDDAFTILASAIAERPLEHSVSALDGVLDDMAKVAPHAAEVATTAVPVVDEVAGRAAPVADESVHVAAAVAKPVAGIAAALPAADDTFRHGIKGAMSFSAGIDDALRLLARF